MVGAAVCSLAGTEMASEAMSLGARSSVSGMATARSIRIWDWSTNLRVGMPRGHDEPKNHTIYISALTCPHAHAHGHGHVHGATQ